MNVGIVDGRTGDNSTHDDEEGTDEHADFATPSIDTGSDEGNSADAAYLVHCRNESGPNTVVGTVEMVQECLVGGEATEEGTVISVHGLTEAAQQQARQENDRGPIVEARWFFEESFVEGLAAFDDLDIGYIRLRVCVRRSPGQSMFVMYRVY